LQHMAIIFIFLKKIYGFFFFQKKKNVGVAGHPNFNQGGGLMPVLKVTEPSP